MRKMLLPLALAIVAISGPSWAWSHVTGSITSIDPKARRIVLNNGTTYTLERDVGVTDLAVGNKVTVNTEMRSGKHIVDSITKPN